MVQNTNPIAGDVRLFANKIISYNLTVLNKEVPVTNRYRTSQFLYFAIRATTIAKRAAPSIRAAAIIIAVWIFEVASG